MEMAESGNRRDGINKKQRGQILAPFVHLFTQGCYFVFALSCNGSG